MPGRLREILGKNAKTRVIIVDRNSAIAPDMGAGPRPVIEDALRKLGVDTRLGAGVASLDKSGVTLPTHYWFSMRQFVDGADDEVLS